MSLCEEQCLMYIQCEEVKERKRQRKVETEVADLRCNCRQCCGIADPRHFGVDQDPELDPRILASDLWIRILLFSP